MTTVQLPAPSFDENIINSMDSAECIYISVRCTFIHFKPDSIDIPRAQTAPGRTRFLNDEEEGARISSEIEAAPGTQKVETNYSNEYSNLWPDEPDLDSEHDQVWCSAAGPEIGGTLVGDALMPQSLTVAGDEQSSGAHRSSMRVKGEGKDFIMQPIQNMQMIGPHMSGSLVMPMRPGMDGGILLCNMPGGYSQVGPTPVVPMVGVGCLPTGPFINPLATPYQTQHQPVQPQPVAPQPQAEAVSTQFQSAAASSSGPAEVDAPPARPSPSRPTPGPSQLAAKGAWDPVPRRYSSAGSGCERIMWQVDARKLQSNDRHIKSPSVPLVFNSSSGKPSSKFRLSVEPSPSGGNSATTNFRLAEGRGIINVYCESLPDDDSTPVENLDTKRGLCSWKIGAFPTFENAMSRVGRQQMLGPFHHDFAEQRRARLPRSFPEFNFKSIVNKTCPPTFVICLEIFPTMNELRDASAL